MFDILGVVILKNKKYLKVNFIENLIKFNIGPECNLLSMNTKMPCNTITCF